MKVKSQKSKVKSHPPGFTLIEIMVVVVIIGLLLAIVSPRLMLQYEKAKVVQTKAQIRNLEQALKLFKLENGFYPSAEQGLKALPLITRSFLL